MKTVYQIVTYGKYGLPTLQHWTRSPEEAEADLKEAQQTWPEGEFWIEEGTDYIFHKCRKCQDVEATERFDYYGISTGIWCESCYEKNYPYRKDAYDPYNEYGTR